MPPRLPRRYLIELTPRESGFDDIRALTGRARAAAAELARAGFPVPFLRSVFVPEDGSCFLLFEAGSMKQARLAATRAQLAVRRIAEVAGATGARYGASSS